MGERSSSFFGMFWDDGEVEESDIFAKIIFAFLFTNRRASTSGIYRITPKQVSDGTGIPRRLVEHYLGTERLNEMELREELSRFVEDIIRDSRRGRGGLPSGVMYDASEGVAFVASRLRYNQSGRPDLKESSIIGDHKVTYRSGHFWSKWKELYRRYIDKNPGLLSYFKTVDGDEEDGESYPSHVFEKRKTGTVVPVDLSRAIQDLLNRYARDLDSEDMSFVLKAIEKVTKNKKTGKPLSEKRRYQILHRLHREPAILVGRASFLFLERGLSDFDDLVIIINTDARDWYAGYIEAVKDGEKHVSGEK